MQPKDSPIFEKLKALNPESFLRAYLKESPYSFFLDSSLNSNRLGEFSFMGSDPFLIFRSKKDRVTLDWVNKRKKISGNPFFILKKLLKEFSVHSQDFPFPFIGGAVGYFSYDLKDFNERLPDFSLDDINIPDAILCFYDTALIFNHVTKELFAVSTGFPEKGERARYRKLARLENLKNKLYAAENSGPENLKLSEKARLTSNFTKDSYVEAVKKAKEYIRKGDIYQVNLSQRFKFSLSMDPFDLYQILRVINPAPFASFLNFGDVKIVSASPERFLKKRARHIETRPIKGTRPRGSTPSEDKKLKGDLMASVKDRAENLMIIDLERNDLGRISRYGSVKVTEFMTCEEYATVFHLVSNIEGSLKKNVDSVDCLISCFPGGSITGAPKIRSMEIIEELEPVKRSVYTGSIGYISFNDNMDTSIVIRTFVIKGKDAYFQVGGGIVHDSVPEREYQETLDKAKALINAIELSTKRRKHEYSVHK